MDEKEGSRKDKLIKKYSFSEEQSEAIVMLQLYKLSSTDIKALQSEQVSFSFTR